MKAPFDETDAPPGYRAVPYDDDDGCRNCALNDKDTNRCVNPFAAPNGPKYDPANPNRFRCVPGGRRDATQVRFVPALYGNEEDA